MPPYNAQSWKKLTNKLAPKVKLGRPATERQIGEVEYKLGVSFPEQLRDFLREADGVTDRYGHGPIWPLARIEEENRKFRTAEGFRDRYMPFDHLLFFGADANGDHFAFPVHADGEIHKKSIFTWDHETDARSWHAAHLEQSLEKQLKRGEDVDDSES